ncbi:MAG: 16S rRNA (uracil(1498)-N(3))-methyltransferase [Alphaproteobacteria bacterium]|jgi:16S rRNA (uracil1498-N3)-methyltransferase|nr:16S rRNA (uracil(1498)-N(3))-methyltransferase [Alphaproteobacteria bacterium]
MTDTAPRIRLYVPDDLADGLVLGLSANQAHYLRHVMRLKAGQAVRLFNGRDGEWRARIEGFGKGWCSLALDGRLAEQTPEAGPLLLFAPLKRARIDALVEKAVELGVAALQPTLTRRTSVGRVNRDRLRLIAIEAAEQCGRLSVPELYAPRDLAALLDDWPAGRRLVFLDEGGGVPPLGDVLATAALPAEGWALLIGPEGGFDDAERGDLTARDFVLPAGLGPRILRAETAALAALTLWQALAGDWRAEA